jgi:hypothetical protein
MLGKPGHEAHQDYQLANLQEKAQPEADYAEMAYGASFLEDTATRYDSSGTSHASAHHPSTSSNLYKYQQ